MAPTLSRAKLNQLWAALERLCITEATTWDFECHLPECRLGPEGARSLAATVMQNTTLRSLDLRDNHIGDEGTVALAVALRTNSALQKVNLRGNCAGPEGSKALAEALLTNATLREVNLEENSIG
eukprot:EG_transcript_48593